MSTSYREIFKKNITTILIFVVLFFLATVFFFFHWPTLRRLERDDANHYYLAQQMSRGYVLYRDLFSDKPPLVEYIGMPCFLICKGNVLSAIILTRFVFFFFYFLSAILLFIISKYILKRPLLAWLAVLVYLSFNYPYDRVALESESHTLMNFFGLFSIIFFLKNYYILSGLFSSFAVLSWQPGIIFFIATLFAAILFSRDNRKKKKLSELSLGFLFPILLLLLRFYVDGSLSDFINQTVLFAEFRIRDLFLSGIVNIPPTINSYYKFNIPIIILGILGFIINLFQIITVRHRNIDVKAHLLPQSILSMFIIFSIVDFQGGVDFIPLLPWLALYAAYPLIFFSKMKKPLIANVISVCLLLCFIIYSLKGSIKKAPFFTLKKQKETMLNELKNFNLKENNLFFCMEFAHPLLFLNKKNLFKYLYFHEDRFYLFIEKYEKGGFDFILNSINEKKPKLVSISKNYYSQVFSQPHYHKLKDLLETAYERFDGREIIMYVRK